MPNNARCKREGNPKPAISAELLRMSSHVASYAALDTLGFIWRASEKVSDLSGACLSLVLCSFI